MELPVLYRRFSLLLYLIDGSIYIWASLGGSDSKESACNVEDLGLIPGLGRPPGGGKPLRDSSLENPHGQRRLAGCSPGGRKESDTTKRLSPAQYI